MSQADVFLIYLYNFTQSSNANTSALELEEGSLYSESSN